MLDVKKLPSMLCPDFVVDVQQVAGKTCIITPMYYPNGDSINIYLRRSGREIIASDEGTTIDNLAHGLIKMTPDRRSLVESICRARGSSFATPSVTKVLKVKTLRDDILSFCQTINDISSLHYHAAHQDRSLFHDAVDAIIQKKVEVVRNVKVSRNWTNPDLDPKGSFPVDYHINESGPARNLFYVTSGSKALLVTAVSHFLKSHKIDIPTLAVVDRDAEIKGRQLNRLQFSSTMLLVGIKGNEKRIVRFALGKAA